MDGVPRARDVHTAVDEIDVRPVEAEDLAVAKAGLDRRPRSVDGQRRLVEREPELLELGVLERSLAALRLRRPQLAPELRDWIARYALLVEGGLEAGVQVAQMLVA